MNSIIQGRLSFLIFIKLLFFLSDLFLYSIICSNIRKKNNNKGYGLFDLPGPVRHFG